MGMKGGITEVPPAHQLKHRGEDDPESEVEHDLTGNCPLRMSEDSRPMRSICSATSPAIPTGSTRRAARHAPARRPLPGLAKLSRRTGKREQALEHLTTATTMYREMDMRFWLEQAQAEMGKLL